MLKIIRK